MNKSETIGKLAKALSIVQGKLNPAIQGNTNSFFKSSYADLNSVWASCRELLVANNLAVVQTNEITLEGVIVETTLMHESGEWIGGQLYLPLSKQDAQGVGSAITYGRRYGLAAIVGIVADTDDDGNAASQLKTIQRTSHNTTQPMQTAPKSAPAEPTGYLSDKQGKAIWAIAKSKGVDENEVIEELFPNMTKAELTMKQAGDVIEYLTKEL